MKVVPEAGSPVPDIIRNAFRYSLACSGTSPVTGQVVSDTGEVREAADMIKSGTLLPSPLQKMLYQQTGATPWLPTISGIWYTNHPSRTQEFGNVIVIIIFSER
jgi:hypothetical protein